MERLEPVLEAEKPDLVMVPGDVNSTLAAVLTAVKMGIRVAHIESGLRSFDRTMPEEINRIVADQFSEYLFLHSEEGIENLRAEGVTEERMHFVGNTMIDTLVALEDRFRAAGAAAAMGMEPGEFVLVTLHRPALVDGPLLAETVGQLAGLANEMPVVFPVHPRTRAKIEDAGLDVPPAVALQDPVTYSVMLALERGARAIATDSGGVQREAYVWGVPCVTLREETEWVETVQTGWNTVVGADAEAFSAALRRERPDQHPPVFGDGRASQKIAQLTVERLEAVLTTQGHA
jgi:UDP-N-acetylglucosamine 2-epimerase